MKTPQGQETQRLRRETRRWKKRCRRLQERTKRLEQEIQDLQEQKRRLQAEVAEYRAKFYKAQAPSASEESLPPRMPKKRGAPKGHPGWYRPVPRHADKHIEVTLDQCPECSGHRLKRCERYEDHYQEDIVLPPVEVTRFRRYFYYCPDCGEVVSGMGEGELPGSYIGPVAKSLSSFLHFQMKVPYRKLQVLFRDVFHLSFTPGAAPGFDRQLWRRGAPVYDRMRRRLPAEPLAHVDETGWRKEGVNYWLWCVAMARMVVYHIDRRRAGQVVTRLLGSRFGGVLISDFLAAYNRIRARKQRCLVHLLRLIKKWQLYFAQEPPRRTYFTRLKELVKSILALSAQWALRQPRHFLIRRADLIARLRRTLRTSLGHPRADKFIAKLSAQWRQLVTCLEVRGVCGHNNLAERLLRDNVILRKITFGNRSDKGLENHQVLMSIIQTARLQKLNPLAILFQLLTHPDTVANALLAPSPSSRG